MAKALRNHFLLWPTIVWCVLVCATTGLAGTLTGMLDLITAGIVLALGLGPLMCVLIDARLASSSPALASLDLEAWGTIDHLLDE